MNIYQANNLDFRDLLSKLGYEPVKTGQGGNDVWYYSPFRSEKDPSFHIRKGRVYDWVWHDFGHEGASTILDFVMQLKNLNKSEALAFLDTIYPNYNPSSYQKQKKDPNQSSFLFPSHSPPQAAILKNKEQKYRDFEFIEALPLKSDAILKYLHSRQISPVIAFKYFKVVKYRHKKKPTQKPYFGFGIQNESGGWEIRSASDEKGRKFKTALLAKDVSLIRGSEQGRGEVNLFEGMTDFVSLLSMFNVEQLKGDTIILNGLKLWGRAADIIREQKYSRINTFLDNNSSGQEVTQKVIDEFQGIVSNQSPSFMPYIDLNNALVAGEKPVFISSIPSSPEP